MIITYQKSTEAAKLVLTSQRKSLKNANNFLPPINEVNGMIAIDFDANGRILSIELVDGYLYLPEHIINKLKLNNSEYSTNSLEIKYDTDNENLTIWMSNENLVGKTKRKYEFNNGSVEFMFCENWNILYVKFYNYKKLLFDDATSQYDNF